MSPPFSVVDFGGWVLTGERVIGGETPINHSVTLFEHLKGRHPGFIEELENKVRASVPGVMGKYYG